MNKKRKQSKLFKERSPIYVIIAIVLTIVTLAILIPLIWGILQSIQDPEDLYNPIPFPLDWKFSNYVTAFEKFYVEVKGKGDEPNTYPTLIYMFGYSSLYAIGAAFLSTFVCCMVGYLTARFDNVFSKILNVFVIIALALPIVGSLPSELQIAKALGIYDKIYGVWFLKCHFISMYYLIFHARFKSFSKANEEAARIDGANYFYIFFRIMLPQVLPLFFTVFLLQFITFWNDYYTPMMFMPSYPTLAYGMWRFNTSTDNTISSIPLKITGCILMLMPVLILFIVFSKRLMANLSAGGDKE